MHAEGIWLRFLSGPDIEGLGISRAEIVEAVADVVTAHGRGQTVFEPRVRLVPDNALTEALPATVTDRPFGRDVETLRDRLSAH